ncbi:DUF1127 domain-containing protein [Rhizobium sp. SAFR-030]|uniref:DUF1127 domain-containing protein n=1 Tax=Rhizobium sp. SAFR-030 TaxID=3387277 RepID=UPI003F7F329D
MSNMQVMVADVVDDLFRKFGFWRVARALLVAAFRRRSHVNDTRHLSDRMLRDIGIHVEDETLKPQSFSLWSIRFPNL